MSAGYYESESALAEYLLFHYGAPEQVLPYSFGPADALEFPVRCVTECLNVKRLPPKARALDLGCAVGRSSFELARFCAQVVGVDFSRRFIETAECLRRDASFPFRFIEEGPVTQAAFASVPAGIDRSRVKFEIGDAQNLRSDLGEFDVILMANLIDRLSDPARCLGRMRALLKPGGQLIITSPYTWLTDYTPRENWLCGCDKSGRTIKTLEALKALLAPDLNLAFRKDLPFLIREHARKFQWSVAEASGWT